MLVDVVAHTYRVPMLDTFEQNSALAQALEDDGLEVQNLDLSIDAHIYVTVFDTNPIAVHASRIERVRNEVMRNVR